MKALVLSGGGSKGAYQAGVISHLLGVEQNVYDIYCGISVGAINAAYLAQVPKGSPALAAERLQEMWMTVSTDKVYKRWFPFGKLHALWKSSVYNSAPLQSWIRSGLDAKAIQSSTNLLRVVSVSWHTGEVSVATEQMTNIADWVVASSAFPVMLSPMQIGNDLWTDGGLRSVTPLGEAIRAGASEIDVILCSDPFAASTLDLSGDGAHALPQLLLRAIDVMNDEVSRADLRIAGLKNSLSQLKPEYKNVRIRIFQPSLPLAFDSLDFSPESVRRMFALGVSDSGISQVI